MNTIVNPWLWFTLFHNVDILAYSKLGRPFGSVFVVYANKNVAILFEFQQIIEFQTDDDILIIVIYFFINHKFEWSEYVSQIAKILIDYFSVNTE